MNSETTELTVIAVALVFFLVLCAVAVWLFRAAITVGNTKETAGGRRKARDKG